MPKQFQHACRFLEHNKRIADYLKAIERNMRLLNEIRSALPPPLDAHCLHAFLDAGVLTLTTDSPVWASRLRFFAPDLARTLRPQNSAIAACRVRIQPFPLGSSRAHLKNRLSSKTAQHLIEAAAGIEDDRLASALRRLADTGARAH